MKDAATWQFASPLSLLNDWRDRADEAPLHELIIIGFTVDLSFLEQVAITTARGLGARITVLGDAGQGLYDPIDVHMAGSSYIHGLVRCAGAFHPKIALLVGETDVWAAVGSGNPTLSGWGANDELWTVVKSSGPLHPLIAEAGRWLRRLAESSQVAMAGWAAELLREVADDIAGRPIATTPTAARLFDNLDEGFLSQLPHGPVEELSLYAPFTDPTGEAIRAIVEHFEPRHTVIAVQPRWTSYDGDALVSTLTGHSLELRFLEETHLRHGKLIQWRVDGRLHALVGSPNLSRSALLRSTTDGGNCELAVMAPVTADLMPDGQNMPLVAVAGRSTVRPSKSPPSLVLLGALVSSKGVEVTLSRAHQRPVTITSSPDGSPGSWQPIGVIPPGEVVLTLTVPEAPGSVIRAVMALGDGRLVESPPVFAVSPAKCARRVAADQGPRLRRQYTTEEVFTDPELAHRFSLDLIRLAEILPRSAGVRPSRPSTDGSVARSAIEDRWTAHLEECGRILGTAFTKLIYGPIASVLPDSSRLSSWSTTALITDDDDEASEEPLEDTNATEAPDITASQRPAYRRWAGRWAESVVRPRGSTPGEPLPGLPPLPLRMLVAGMYVKLMAAGLWDHNDDGWRDQLARLLEALVPRDEDDAPEESRERLCTLIAVCMTLLRSGATLTGGTPNDILAARTWNKVKSLVAEADQELGADLLFRPVQPRARTASPAALAGLIRLALDADPLAAIKAEMASAEWDITEENGLWEITGGFTNSTPVAARVATLIGETGRTALVLARTSKNWTLIAWRRPDMVLLSFPASCWRVYHVPTPMTPESRLKSGDLASAGGLVGKPVNMRQPPPPKVEELLSDCGFTPSELRDRIL